MVDNPRGQALGSNDFLGESRLPLRPDLVMKVASCSRFDAGGYCCGHLKDSRCTHRACKVVDTESGGYNRGWPLALPVSRCDRLL